MKIAVNQEHLPEEMIRREMQTWQQQHPGASEVAAFEAVSQRMIEWTLIRQAAEKQITVTPEEVEMGFQVLCKQHGGQEAFLKRFGLKAGAVDHVKEDVKRHRQSTKLLDGLVADVAAPMDTDVEAYYYAHPETFLHPETVHAAHIVKHPKQEAEEEAAATELTSLRTRLLAGEDFLTVAHEASDCNDSSPDLGTFPRGKMVPEFELVVFSMQPGEISPVFKTPFGLHVATVLGRNEAVAMTLDEAKPHIQKRLEEDAKNETIRTWVQAQRETADIALQPPAPAD